MGNNKTKIDSLHDLLPKHLNTRTNTNWKAIIEAIGAEDQRLADLITLIKDQFSVKTASKEYLDRLGANYNVSRPRFIGMDDSDYRKFIPVFSYQPKQVKSIIDTLLDMLFFKESTTSYTETSNSEPYFLQNGWELEYKVDDYNIEKISFSNDDFSDITNATAEEIAAAINRKAQNSFAIPIYNNTNNTTAIRLFTNTVGSHGSIEIIGGRACISLHFDGFINEAANASNTEWTVTKVGDTVTFKFTGGISPELNFIKDGDIFISNITGNIGSFIIDSINIASNEFTFKNVFATVGVFTQNSSLDTKFIRPYKARIFLKDKRAVMWETRSGSITVEMPSSPPIVKRKLSGSWHINGSIGTMTEYISPTSLKISSSDFWSNSGCFQIQEQQTIKTRLYNLPYEDTTTELVTRTRLDGFQQKYTYSSLSYDPILKIYTIDGIVPNLPSISSLNQFDVDNITIPVGPINTMRVVTLTPHNYQVGERAIISDTVYNLPNSTNGTFLITNIVNSTTFDVETSSPGTTSMTQGFVRVERQGMSETGSILLSCSSNSASDTGILGSYLWDKNSQYVISSYTGTIAENIIAGQNKKTITLGSNNLLNEKNQFILDFGTEQEEGPIQYLYKASSNVIIIDPSYIFKHSHTSGTSTITVINSKGSHTVSSNGLEYAPYITDPSVARATLQDLILQVKSAGVFVEFLIRYPQQIYATIDVYNSGVDPG